MSNILVFSPSPVPVKGKLVAGPGIRSWEIARGLQKYGHKVTLAIPENVQGIETDVPLVRWTENNLKSISSGYDCIILPQGHPVLSRQYVKCVDKNIPTVIDVYTPNFVESLNIFEPNVSGLRMFASYQDHIIPLLKRGDYFICSSEKQRLYYLGVLSALGRINPLTYGNEMIGIVPFGVPEGKPIHDKNVLKGKMVDKNDFVILWFGGIYPWYDAVILIRALKILTDKMKNIKLVFLGATHPTEIIPLKSYQNTVNEIKRLKLTDYVIFVDWQPYEERANWYFESDVVICTYMHTLETELSYRTRVIDYIWGGLPVITSGGDEVSNLLNENMCGEIVEPGNSDMLAKTILDLTIDRARLDNMRNNQAALAKRLSWSYVLKPLHDFCINPRLSQDRQNEKSREILDLMVGSYFEHHIVFKRNDRLLGRFNTAFQNICMTISYANDIRRKEGTTSLIRKVCYRYFRLK